MVSMEKNSVHVSVDAGLNFLSMFVGSFLVAPASRVTQQRRKRRRVKAGRMGQRSLQMGRNAGVVSRDLVFFWARTRWPSTDSYWLKFTVVSRVAFEVV
jgi:hypothetical protein